MDERAEHHVPTDNPEVQHETSDVNVMALGKFGLAFVISMFVIYFGLYFMFQSMEARSERNDPDPVSLVQPGVFRQPPVPNLQRLNTAPPIEMHQMREREAQNLGIAEGQAPQPNRISIEEAMKLSVERGFPVQAISAPPQAQPEPNR